MIATIVIVSFFLEGFVNNLISLNSLFIPVFLVSSLLIIYPYCNNNNKKFLMICSIVGMFYDLIYTDSLFLNVIMFLIIGVIIIKLNEYMNYNLLNICILDIIIIIIYRLLTYLVLYILSYINFDINILLKGIYSSFISNIIYCVIFYMIVSYISKKFNIKKA